MIKKHEILTGVLTGLLLAMIGWAWNAESRFVLLEHNQQQILQEHSKSDIERKELIKSFNDMNITLTELKTELRYLKLNRNK